jgi:hypothetical protein
MLCLHPLRFSFFVLVLLGVASMAGSLSAGEIELVVGTDSSAVEFAATDVAAALARDNIVSRRSADQPRPTKSDGRVVLVLEDSADARTALAEKRFPALGQLRAEGFSIRVASDREGNLETWVIGHDDAGLMYGGLELAELVRTRGLAAVTNSDHNAHFAVRGVKFNIPLDVRTPSYTDAGDSAQQNIATVWDMAFWREYIDRLARDRYNLVSLWNLHPFPSLVRVPEYPDVALADVQRSTGKWKEYYSTWAVGLDAPEIVDHVETIRRLTMDEKIAFWREVMRYGRSRNVKFFIVTWNVFVNGTGGKYGLTTALENPATIDYFRRSVRELVLTYPDLAGIGLTTGENMLDASPAQKEDWAFRTYGLGVLDALALQPGRKITFLHRQHEAGAAEIAKTFAPVMANPDIDFIYSFKYAEAHALSSTTQKFHENFVKDVGDQPILWTLRNDDAYVLRWGAPQFVREFLKNIPVKNTRGFYYGSDQWVWGRDFLDVLRPPDAPRQLEHDKHWYHWMLWGRLGFDADLTDERIQALIAERFPMIDAGRLMEAWQEASLIYPLTTGFHWGRFDFQWYPEGSKSRPEPAQTPTGFHDINRFISLPPHPASDNLSIPDYVKSVRSGQPRSGTTPSQVAVRLQAHADRALSLAGELERALHGVSANETSPTGGSVTTTGSSTDELQRTLSDIQAMAHLGNYYAHKIRAATALALFRAAGDSAQHATAGAELNESAFHWRSYASTLLTYSKNPVWMNRVGNVDWREVYDAVLYDLTTTNCVIAVPSMTPTPGGVLLEAEDAAAEGAPVQSTAPGFTGNGYRDLNGSQGRRWIEWTFDAPAAGKYLLEFRYAMRRDETGDAPLTINGQPAGNLVIWRTGGVKTWACDRKVVSLRGGKNTIRLNPPLGPNVDHLNVLPLER